MRKDEKGFLFIIFIFLLSLGLIMPLMRKGMGENDFIGYWSSTRLLITGGNPYSHYDLRNIQEQVRNGDKNLLETIMVWNPPWLMLVLTPLSLFSFNLATRIWLLVNIFLVGLSLYLSWILSKRSPNEKAFLILIGTGFVFIPTLILLDLGQISTIILISLILFIFLIESERDTLAGMILLMGTIKPHVSYLALLVIFIWIFRTRRYKVAFSFVITAAISALVTWLINPTWIRDYIFTLGSLPYENLSTSTFGSFMYDVFGIQIFKYSFIFLLPLAFFLSNATEKIGYFTSLNLALLLSIPLSPYGFVFDQILLLPTLAQIIAWMSLFNRPTGVRLIVSSGLVVIFVLNTWIASHDRVLSSYFFWVPLALLPIYLLSIKHMGTDTLMAIAR